MPVLLPLPELISQSSQKQVKQRVLQARFGEGYQQVAADGINSIFEIWSISWDALSLSQRNTVVTALLLGATDYLLWTPVGDSVQKKYLITPQPTVDLYSETQTGGYIFTISCTLLQVR